MSALPTLDYETVLRIVRDWPPEQRVIFLQDVLKTLITAVDPARTHKATLAQARGLLATERPAPTDEEVSRLLGERRAERYGLCSSDARAFTGAASLPDIGDAFAMAEALAAV
jgi:hypothetical protein